MFIPPSLDIVPRVTQKSSSVYVEIMVMIVPPMAALTDTWGKITDIQRAERGDFQVALARPRVEKYEMDTWAQELRDFPLAVNLPSRKLQPIKLTLVLDPLRANAA